MFDAKILQKLFIQLKAVEDLDLLDTYQDRERLSKDFFDYSPILQEQLQGCLADIVVRPHSFEAWSHSCCWPRHGR